MQQNLVDCVEIIKLFVTKLFFSYYYYYFLFVFVFFSFFYSKFDSIHIILY